MDYRFTYSSLDDTDSPLSVAEALRNCGKQLNSFEFRHMGLSLIGRIPSRYETIQSLDLSHNSLKSLRGLSVLKHLATGTFSYNSLSVLKSLTDLFELPQLRAVDLRGNKICSLVSYRSTIVQNIPSLTTLDGLSVSSNQRNSGLLSRLASQIASNEDTFLRLESLKSKLRVHRQLIISNFVVEYSGVNISSFLRMVACPQNCEDVRSWVVDKINAQDCQFAVAECLSDQQQRIEELMTVCEDLSKECLKLFNGHDENSFVNRKNRRSCSRIEFLDDRINYSRIKENDTNAIQNAINEGLSVVIEKFKSTNILKRTFSRLKKILNQKKKLKLFLQESTAHKMKIVMDCWKGHTESRYKPSTIHKKFRGINDTFTRKHQTSIQKFNYEHERLLQFAKFHREKKIKTKVFQNWKSIYSSFNRDQPNYKHINARLNELGKSLTNTKGNSAGHSFKILGESNFDRRPILGHFKEKEELLNTSYQAFKQNLQSRSITPMLRPSSQNSKYSDTKYLKEHFRYRVDHLDKQLAMRTSGTRLIEDIYQKLDSIEGKLLTRHHLRF